MFKKPNCPVIAIEEHYWDAELAKTYTGPEAGRPGPADGAAVRSRRAAPQGDGRGRHRHAGDLARRAVGAEAAGGRRGGAGARRQRPARRGLRRQSRSASPAFAALPTADPKAAADELERCVTKLGFKGAMMHGLTNGVFLDDKQFWPIYERAEKLDVPIYFHPACRIARVVEAYYKDYAKDFPMVVRAAWGYTVETATTAIRLVLSGVFDKHPKLKIILGHLGETLPFLVWRIDHAIARPGAASRSASATSSATTSGSPPAATSPTRR